MVKSHGLRDWLAQRVTAAVMAVYTVLFAATLFVQRPSHYEAWKALFSPGWMRVATLLVLLSLYWHAWLGMHDILIDYVKPAGLHRLSKTLVMLALAVYAVWSVRILWSV